MHKQKHSEIANKFKSDTVQIGTIDSGKIGDPLKFVINANDKQYTIWMGWNATFPWNSALTTTIIIKKTTQHEYSEQKGHKTLEEAFEHVINVPTATE